MKLISIKSHGFKSFADKIDIKVRDGITGIVGPNGSGKSNIVDAIKWVLGEQSIKNLRGSNNMTDVIFQGSNSRKPMTRAWVSLTFDNSDKYLNSELTEIEIKRVVYSTGDNEYYINNTKVRLKDITDLFLDSGSSTNSFSIISQGKISEILNGKKEDRRLIIEEAAGILKYKKHKEETLKKIEKSNDNIEKIDLLIKELSTNLEPLKIERDNALKYKKIKEEKDNIDIVLTAIDIKDSTNRINELKLNIESINNELLNIDSTNTKDISIIETLKLKNTKLETKINELNQKLININKEISDAEALKQITLERKKFEVDDIKIQDNIVLLKEKKLTIEKDIKVLKNEINILKKDQEETLIKKDNLINDYKKSKINIDELDKIIKTNTLKEETLKNKINILENNLLNNYSIPNSVKNILNSSSLNGIHNIIGNLIDTEVIYKDALSNALGYSTNYVVVEDTLSAKNAVNYLKEKKLGKCTFYPLDVIKPKYVDNETLNKSKTVKGFINTLDKLVEYNSKYENVILNLLGNILVVDNIDTMNTLGKLINYTYRVVTLDGDILNRGGSITGGYNKLTNNVILDKYELNNTKNELDTIILKNKNNKEILDKSLEELNIIENNLNNINKIINNIENRLEIKLNNLSNLEKNKQDIDNEINGNSSLINKTQDKKLDEILNNYYELNSKKEILETELNKLKTDRTENITEINNIELNNKKINSNYNKLTNNLKTNEIELSKLEIKTDNNLIKLNEEYNMTYDNAIKNYDLNIDIKENSNKLNTLKYELSLIDNVNLGSIEEYNRINERFEYLTKEKMDLVNSINNLLTIIDDLDSTIKDKFLTTFNKVNIEFNKVFKKLFKGGNAELKLDDKNDLLNTGVEIIACPPGKTLKTINLLSGGEKTLTAIALLFSILNIRYVPFCILDEVEAALDEANVDMFGNYINEYKNKTEFIIITHKKRTMEYVDTLYGITMQESGVSKLVSVKLDEIK